MFQPYLADYTYYALFRNMAHGPASESADALVRSFGPFDEQQYLGHHRWEWTGVLEDARRFKGRYDDSYEVTEAEAAQIRLLIDARQDTAGDLAQEALSIQAKRAARHPDGAFASYRTAIDMIDFESACSVTDDLPPDHGPALRVAIYERPKLEAWIALRTARRQAEPVDGHYYFALFRSLRDVLDLSGAHTLIRCPDTGRIPWEIYRDGWEKGGHPGSEWALPLARADIDRVQAAVRQAPRP
ncbi:hypothetical protein JNUCC0626_21130 [Lentzea sp. JNUCC 0626]|uniref:hypothetical protein n=1 Tax=Lentzea sp. JNUCC 0626 TaxID=3367513 RepID=UPI003749DF34